MLRELIEAAKVAEGYASTRTSVTVSLSPRGLRIVGVRFGKGRREFVLHWQQVDAHPTRIVDYVREVGRWTQAVADKLDVES